MSDDLSNVEATITFHTAREPLNRQGLVDLMLALEEGYRFVVIDTLVARWGGPTSWMQPI